MPHITSLGSAQFNIPLTNVSTAFIQGQEKYGAASMVRTIMVTDKSGVFFEWPKESFLRDEARPRGPGAHSAGSGVELITKDYLTRVFALHTLVPDQHRAAQHAAVNLDVAATEYVTGQMLQRREKQSLDDLWTTGKWSKDFDPDVDGNGHWDDGAGTPIEDIRGEMDRIEGTTGFRPNVLGLGPAAWNTLADSADFLGRVTGGATTGAPAMVLKRHLADILELEEVIIPRAVLNSSQQGAATPSIAYMHGDEALLLYRPSSPGLMTPAAAYQFVWSDLGGAGVAGMAMKRFRREELSATQVEGEIAFQFKLVSPELGSLFINVNT